MGTRTEALRPMRDLLVRLPRLPMTRKQEIDFPAADPALLVVIADDAETTMNAIHHGVGAIGHLLAHSAPNPLLQYACRNWLPESRHPKTGSYLR